MAKGQMRSNKETRKPKAEKPKPGAAPAAKLLGASQVTPKDKK